MTIFHEQEAALQTSQSSTAPMDALIIDGGRQLSGELAVSGAKNAVLPMMAAAILAPGTTELTRVPRLRDVTTMARVLSTIGAQVELDGDVLRIDSTPCESAVAPYELVKTMRASIYVLGPLLARFGRAQVSLPGGCAWGPRPVDLHLRGMEALGARVSLDHGYIVAEAERLRGQEINFPIISVGATGNVLMAAVTADGDTVIRNAAREPEITALAAFLSAMGAQIDGAGTSEIRVQGVAALEPAAVEVIPDRIEAGTFVIAGAMAGGRVRVTGANPQHLGALLDCLGTMGVALEVGEDWIEVEGGRRPESIAMTTAEFPGFATDLQAQLMAMAALGRGESTLCDAIYPDRFKHVPELGRLGADIEVTGNTARVRGVEALAGAPVMASDLRASAALILAGLVASGTTRVGRVYHIDRGYEQIEHKLAAVGANVRRVRD